MKSCKPLKSQWINYQQNTCAPLKRIGSQQISCRQGAFIVLDNNLNYLYSTCIGSGKSDFSASFSGLALNKYGVFLGGKVSGSGFSKGSVPSWSNSSQSAKSASMVNIQWK